MEWKGINIFIAFKRVCMLQRQEMVVEPGQGQLRA